MMKTMLRLTVAGLTLAALGSAASADPLTFDTGLVKEKKATDINGEEIGVFLFSGGVWAYDSTIPNFSDTFKNPSSGFIANQDISATGNNVGIISVSLSDKLSKNFIRSVKFDGFYGSEKLFLDWYDKAGKKVGESDNTTPGKLNWTSSYELKFDDQQMVTEVRFQALQGGFRNFLGIDNLEIALGGPTTPVPEPSSYALVGLALLAAGAARRRKV